MVDTYSFTSYDCPFEESQEFLLLDCEFRLLCNKRLEVMYGSYLLMNNSLVGPAGGRVGISRVENVGRFAGAAKPLDVVSPIASAAFGHGVDLPSHISGGRPPLWS